MLLRESKVKIFNIIIGLLTIHSALKFNIVVESTYIKKLTNEIKLRNFKTKNVSVFSMSSLNGILIGMFKKICDEESEYERKGSGLSLHYVDGILLRISRY